MSNTDLDYVDAFLRPWGRLEFDPEAVGTPLPAALFDAVASAAIAEENTVVEARKGQSLGLFRHRDLATFLPVWEAEESEHGRALVAVTSLNDSTRNRLIKMTRTEVLAERLKTMTLPFSRFIPGMDIVYCLTGYIGEYHTVTLYHEIAKRCTSDAHRELFQAIARQEGRHFRFYSAAVHARTQNKGLSVRVARWVMRWFWLPVSADCLGAAAFKANFSELLSDPELVTRLLHSDELVDQIPGLSGLNLMHRFFEREGLLAAASLN